MRRAVQLLRAVVPLAAALTARPVRGGEMVARPFTFEGDRLTVNYSTSAAGGVRVEIQDAAGKPLPGYALSDADPLIGD